MGSEMCIRDRYYVETDFDYEKALSEAREKLEKAKKAFLEKVEQKKLSSEEKEELMKWFKRVLELSSLNPDHHFYYDQGTQCRLGYIIRQLGKKFVEAGILEDPLDIFYLRYYELKKIYADPKAFDAKKLTKERRRQYEEEYRKTPYYGWFGTATEYALTPDVWRAYWGWSEEAIKEYEKIKEVVLGKRAPPKVIKGLSLIHI